jgi:hypothetical protein
VFTPAHTVGIDDGNTTHSNEFDQPPAPGKRGQANFK